MDLSQTLLVTHKNCMDGTTCALLFLAAGGKRENIHFTNPTHSESDELVRDLIGDKDILLVDVSMSEKLANTIQTSVFDISIEVIDHHASAMPLKMYSFCHIDEKNESCGSKLFYDWLLSNTTENHGRIRKYKGLVNLVDDIDRWVNQYPESRQLANLHKQIGSQLFFERFLKNPDTELNPKEIYLLEMYDKKQEIDIRNKKKGLRIVTLRLGKDIYKFGFVVCSSGEDPSVLGNDICEDMQLEVDVAVLISGDGISFRRNRNCNLDLSKFSSVFSGGGHKAAAGCQLSGITGIDLIQTVSRGMVNKLIGERNEFIS